MSFLSTMLSSTARTWNRDSASTTVMAAWDGNSRTDDQNDQRAHAAASLGSLTAKPAGREASSPSSSWPRRGSGGAR